MNIIDTRKKFKKSTFCAFIDFKKNYDTINRSILWKRLSDIGISGKMIQAIKSLYACVKSCVRLNSYKTDCGLRQGCVLSPLLFNLFINNLAIFLKSLDLGVKIGDENVCVMLYADDIVLLAESETDLQLLLNALYDWCGRNDMTVNLVKSNVVHFRQNSVSKTDFVFTFGDGSISVIDRYTYFGVVLSEHLDYNIMVIVSLRVLVELLDYSLPNVKLSAVFHIMYLPNCMILLYGLLSTTLRQYGVCVRILV